MITFKQFLMEEPTDLKAMLEKDCSEFLALENGHGQLFRGIRRIRADAREITDPSDPEEKIQYYKKEVRTERDPADTSRMLHDALDDWFMAHLGISARKGSMFCFGGEGAHNTRQYGTRYVVFPIGPMKFAWSPKVFDLYQEIDVKPGFKYDFKNADKDEREVLLNAKMDQLKYTNKNLPAAMNSGNEIMVECEAYYAFDDKYAEKIADLLTTQRTDLEKTEDPPHGDSDE